MDAKTFAINAHKGQVRKVEPDKPIIVHPINVANILKEYGFSSDVVNAGYLHDVVEDTDYTICDIGKYFGKDIMMLVEAATEQDKTLSWEERKQNKIDKVKKLDLKSKALICADKISNIEDLINLAGKQGKRSFHNLKRGFDKQKWYYENIYQSLIYNEEELPIFKRLGELIEKMFNFDFTKISDKEKEIYEKQEIEKLASIIDEKANFDCENLKKLRKYYIEKINSFYY